MQILPPNHQNTRLRRNKLSVIGLLVMVNGTSLSHAQTDAVVAALAPVEDKSNWIQFPPKPSKPVQATRDSVAPKEPSPVAAPPKAVEPPPKATQAPVPNPSPAPAVPTVPSSAATGIEIVSFELSGNQALSTAELNQVLKPYLGFKTNMGDFEKITDEVTRAYRKKGLLARADLPKQELSDGVLRILVTEAIYGGTVVQDPDGLMTASKHIVNVIERRQPVGKAIDLNAMETASALAADLPGIKTQISLQPGQTAGETVALVQVSRGKEKEMQIGMDNHGSRSVGEFRQTLMFNINNPSQRADKVGINLLNSQGVKFGRLSYSLPVGYLGWRLQAYASAMHYKLTNSEFSPLNAEGPSSTQGLELSTPLFKDSQHSVNFNITSELKQYRNDAADHVVSQYKGQSTAFSLESSSQDVLTGSQQNTSATWVLGLLDLGPSTPEHIAADAATTQTAGHFQKLRLNHSQRVGLGNANALFGQVQAQWANKNLDGAEKFYLGGAQGVRAYPANEGGGSQATFLSMEYQHQIPAGHSNLTLAGFYDWGNVTINKYNAFAAATALNSYQLQGAGLWVGSSFQTGMGMADIKLTWARRIGNNPNASAQGLDQDGSLVLNRYLLNMKYGF